MKKLYRSKTNKTFTGLLGGIGESLNVDPIIVRLIFILLVIVTHIWPAILIYIIGYLIVPVRPDVEVVSEEKTDTEHHV